MSYRSLLKITDLPTDRLQALGKLRTVLVGTFNKSREQNHRMTLLKATIKVMHTKIVEFEKEEAKAYDIKVAAIEAADRAETLAVAAESGIDLDERLSNEKLADALSVALTTKTNEETT